MKAATGAGCPAGGTARRPGGCPVSGAESFDPFGPVYLADPPGSLTWARESAPVFFDADLGYWVISRYEDVKEVFRDNETFSPSIALEKITPVTPEALAVLESYDYAMNRTLVNEDEPAHLPRRRALQGPFQPAEVTRHEELVRDLARSFVDGFIDSGRTDLVDSMLYELPLTVALHFLGVPEEDMAKLREYSVSHTLNTWGRPNPEQQVEVAESVGKFWEYAGGVIEKLRLDPSGHGWMPYSIRLQQELPDVVTDSYLHSMMMAGLVAAHETTAHAASNAVRLLLENRDAWDAICADPSLIPGAVDECLRHTGSVAAWRRLALTDTEIAGVAIPAGAKLLIVNSSANHDERHFEDPDALDIFRDNADDHLTFGYGAHRCLGKHLARLELQVILHELTTRLPHMRIDATQEFTFLPNTSFRGPEHLWVEWDPALNPERMGPVASGRRREIQVGSKPQTRRTVVVESRRLVASDVMEVTLAPADAPSRGGRLPGWSAGSHLDVMCGDVSRQYSLCGPRGGDRYQIAVRLEEAGRGGSRFIHTELQVGDEVMIKGPRNHFRLQRGFSRYVLVAGGIGITPIIAMADELKAAGQDYEIHYAGRSRASMAFRDRLDAEHAGRVWLYVGDEGQRLDVAGLMAGPIDGRAFLACGPDRLIEAIEDAGETWPPGHVEVEHFSALGNQLDPAHEHEFEIELVESQATVVVPSDRTVLQALRSAGFDVESDCEEGICGACEVPVIAGGIDHRDRVLSPQERAAQDRMMTCCSRAVGARMSLGL
ncbi:MAG: cytochrome P450/oxidoreductase [Nocardioides sp.]|uniref:cytochrome P450/oxidoreductase n=1 Tax=Nocardioides sp. TaxID=35761 RepID=UPI0039E6D896